MHLVFRTNLSDQKPQDDYKWYCLKESGWAICPPSGHMPDIPEAEVVSRAFATIRASGFFVLMRDRGRLSLTVDVRTVRREIAPTGRPIGDTVCLLAEDAMEETLLSNYAKQALVANDEQGLGNPASEIAASIDEIWRSGSLKAFSERFGAGGEDGADDIQPDDSWIYPRKDMSTRCAVAQKIAAKVQSGKTFLLALTDRMPGEAMQSLSGFSGDYCVFSSKVEHAEKVVRSDFTPPLPRQTGKELLFVLVAAAIVVLLLILRACNGPEEKSCTISSTNVAPCKITLQSNVGQFKTALPTNVASLKTTLPINVAP